MIDIYGVYIRCQLRFLTQSISASTGFALFDKHNNLSTMRSVNALDKKAKNEIDKTIRATYETHIKRDPC